MKLKRRAENKWFVDEGWLWEDECLQNGRKQLQWVDSELQCMGRGQGKGMCQSTEFQNWTFPGGTFLGHDTVWSEVLPFEYNEYLQVDITGVGVTSLMKHKYGGSSNSILAKDEVEADPGTRAESPKKGGLTNWGVTYSNTSEKRGYHHGAPYAQERSRKADGAMLLEMLSRSQEEGTFSPSSKMEE